MKSAMAIGTVLLLAAFSRPPALYAEPDVPQKAGAAPGAASLASELDPPRGDGAVKVRATFHLLDINEIDEEAETFEFTGVLTLTWMDKRQAFDPVEAGVEEKIYQGDYQFDQLSPAWYPQVVLVNVSGFYENSAVMLGVEPDGSSTLIQTVNAIAEARLELRRTPFDSQRLEAVFQIFGFDTSDVTLVTEPLTEGKQLPEIRISHWRLSDLEHSIRTMEAPYAGKQGNSAAFVLTLNVQRESFFMVRLVIIPLTLIVMLSWSVFWMDRSSLGDRMSVSFVGILTAVTYQIVLGDIMPQISYLTLMNGFLNISFLVMCATVVINLIVGAADKKGFSRLGDRIDRGSRLAFPLIYFGSLSAAVAIAFLWF